MASVKPTRKRISLNDIKGDIHVHTAEGSPNDALNTIEQLASFYRENTSFDYAALANHCWAKNPSLLQKTKKRIETTSKNGFQFINGLELNILASSIYMKDDVLDSELNIASIHARPDDPCKDVTKRLCMALRNPRIDILGHPGYYYPEYLEGVDWEKVSDVAIEFNKAIEINYSEIFFLYGFGEKEGSDLLRTEVQPSTDVYILKDPIIKVFVEKGVLLSLGSDLHSLKFINSGEGIENFNYQLGKIVEYLSNQGVQKDQVLNTLSYSELQDWIRSHRGSLLP